MNRTTYRAAYLLAGFVLASVSAYHVSTEYVLPVLGLFTAGVAIGMARPNVFVGDRELR